MIGKDGETMYTTEEVKRQMMETVKKVKAENPMAGSITNSVTINFVANAQLAIGGSAAKIGRAHV